MSATETLEHTASPAEEQRREAIYRRNFWLFMYDFVVFTIGINLIGASTVVPDFVRQLTDSEILIAFSSQMFEVGWLLPQLLIAQQLVHVANKKWWFIGPNIPVRLIMLIAAIVICRADSSDTTLILGVFLVAYAIAGLGDGLVGVPWLDLLGSSLDNQRRARLFGLGNATTGLLLLGLTPMVRFILGDTGLEFPDNYALLFGIAGVLFLVTIPPTFFIHELPGGKVRESAPTLAEYLPELGRVLRHDHPYRAMVGARVLAGLGAMAMPFYIGFGTEKLGMANDIAVSHLLFMQTLGSISGSLAFSWMGARRNLPFIRMVLLIGTIQPLLALLAGEVGRAPLYVAFLSAGLVSGRMGLGFLNWLVAYASPEDRPIYSGMFNTMLAVSLFGAPFMGDTLVEQFGYQAVFAASFGLYLAALVVTLRPIPTRPQPGTA